MKVRIIFREKTEEDNFCKLFYSNPTNFPIQDIQASCDDESIKIYPFILLNDYILDFNQELGVMIPRIIQNMEFIEPIKEIFTIDEEDVSLVSFFIANLNNENYQKKNFGFITQFLEQFNIKLPFPYGIIYKLTL